ncbi:MAG: nucleoside kinase [Treponema sp.]|jgi:uridine kinase|nr:nucleoside kinase [Treponema sp.]
MSNNMQNLSASLQKPDAGADREAVEIYRRTLAFLLSAVVRAALPYRSLYICHSMGKAYYYTFTHGPKISGDEIIKLKSEMQRLIEQDIKIYTRSISYGEAFEYFTKNEQNDSAMLISQRGNAFIKVNQLNDFMDLFNGPLLASTGLLSLFDVSLYHEGFLLRFPSVYDKNRFEDFPESPQIFAAYEEYKKLGRITGVRSACHINKFISDGSIKEFIRTNEAFQEKKLAVIANEIYERRGSVKFILIAGPSSSGKTTTAKRLSVHLKVLGIEPIQVSLDDYYLHPGKAPKDEYGQPDLESIEALDVEYLNKQLMDLLDGKAVTLPSFDFRTCVRAEGKTIRLGERREALVIEGIHGLNDALTHLIKPENKFKIYVSVLTQINIDDHNRVSARDNRLLRRIVRDNQFRGMSAARTLAMWDNVQRGAEKYIFKFENSADAVFNSALDYEIPVLKCYAEHLLRGIIPETPEHNEARRLLKFLDNFNTLPPHFVPGISILREFIGGSDFKY